MRAAVWTRGCRCRWIPQALPRSTHPILVLGRVAAGVSIDAAQGEMAAVMAALEREFPDDNKARGAHVEPLLTVIFGSGAAGARRAGRRRRLVLLLAAANVGNLVLVRATTRGAKWRCGPPLARRRRGLRASS